MVVLSCAHFSNCITQAQKSSAWSSLSSSSPSSSRWCSGSTPRRKDDRPFPEEDRFTIILMMLMMLMLLMMLMMMQIMLEMLMMMMTMQWYWYEGVSFQLRTSTYDDVWWCCDDEDGDTIGDTNAEGASSQLRTYTTVLFFHRRAEVGLTNQVIILLNLMLMMMMMMMIASQTRWSSSWTLISMMMTIEI